METEKICPSCRKPLPPDVPMGLCPQCLIKSGFPTGGDPSATTHAGFVPPSVEEIAKLFPQFEILSFIGKGGMGAVYKARQPALDRFIALKILPPEVANDPGFAERFNREARTLARLNHPNIVAVYDFGKAGAQHYLAMEFVDGANLREVEQSGKLSTEQALAIVPQICEALQFAHNEGVVHRDIKPENLLLDKKGRLKITDFGIAKILNVAADKAALTGVRDVVGTPHYMAPEQIEKPQTVDHRADIYSLGVVFYEMLTGELPLGKFAPPSKKVQVDVRLDEVVLHTLEKEPSRRYQQASQIKTDVETITTTAAPPPIGSAPTTSAVPPPIPSLQPKNTSDKIILPAFLLAFFFGVFGAHRFYVGKIGTAIAQLFTLGGLGIWSTIDWILILCKVFTDADGKRLTNWWHPNDFAGQPPKPPKGPALAKAPGNVPGSSLMIVAPAVALMVAGFIMLFKALKDLVFYHWPGYQSFNNLFFHLGLPYPMAPFFETVLFRIVPALVIIYGAIHMVRLRCYGWAIASAIVSIVLCSPVGFIAGVWALIVLALEEVRTTFQNPEKRENPKWPMILGITGAATFLLFLVFNIADNLPNHHAEVHKLTKKDHLPETVPPKWPSPYSTDSKRLQELQKELKKAEAELDSVEARFKTGAANSLDVQLAKDKREVAGARRILELQTPGFKNGQVTPEAYQEDQVNLDQAEAKFQSDEAEIQRSNAQAATNGNSASFTVVANGSAPIAYQWYYNGSNASTVTPVQTSATNSGNPNPTWELYLDDKNSTTSTVASNETTQQSHQWQLSVTDTSHNSPGQGGPTAATDTFSTVSVPRAKSAIIYAQDAQDFSQSFTVEPGGKLTMHVDRGDVQITSADQNNVEIRLEREVTHANDSEASKILKEENVTFKQTGNQISITAENPSSLQHLSIFGSHANLDAHYEITVPRRFDVQAETAGGGVKVTGIQGNADVKTMGGNLDCEDIDGDVDAQTMGGDVQATGCNGKLLLKTMGGSITVERFKGPSIQATTEGGSVSADLLVAPTSDCKLGTSGGNVSLRLPADAAVTLDAQTEGGSIDTDFPIQVAHHFANDSLNGTLNGGGPTLKLETTGGSIEISKQ